MKYDITYGDLAMGARFLWALPSFLRHPLDMREARRILRHRLQNLGTDFLFLAKRAIYDNPESPYLELLRAAGCEYGDMEAMVRRDGLEGTLKSLLGRGVYLTVDEFKCRRPVVRGSARFEFSPHQLFNPLSKAQVAAETGHGSLVAADFASLYDSSVNKGLVMQARGGLHWAHAMWSVPGGATLVELLEYRKFGAPMTRWFSQVDPADATIHPRYRCSIRALAWAGRLSGTPMPQPEWVSMDDPLPILNWIKETLAAGRTPHLRTFVSSGVRLCSRAMQMGLDLHGCKLLLGGEPMTASRLETVNRSGAKAQVHFGNTEARPVGQGCLAAEHADELHQFHDLNALVQPETDALELPYHAILLSSLRRTAPLILLNVSTGDQATVTRRECGCALEGLGWTKHIHSIRSFEKLTAGGMTFLNYDIVKVLEEVLPKRFGGGPTDFQLVETERGDGSPLLKLLVNPSIGPVDEPAVREVFLDAVGAESDATQLMGLFWRRANMLEVEKRPPLATSSGKIHHLHVVSKRVAPHG